MPKRIAIVQTNYIPWKGYFDIISFVDEFILFDDMHNIQEGTGEAETKSRYQIA